MDLTAFRAALGDIPVEDHPRIVQQKSRDHYWYSPRLKAELDHVTAQLVVSPRTQDEVVTVLARGLQARRAGDAARRRHRQLWAGHAALGRRHPRPRSSLDTVIAITPDRVRAEAGIILEKLDEQTIDGRRRRDALPSLDLSHGDARRLHRRRLGRRRLDPLGRAAEFRQSSSGSRSSPARQSRACSISPAPTSSRSRTPTAPTASSSKPRCR